MAIRTRTPIARSSTRCRCATSGQASGWIASSSICTFRSARCGAASATCSPPPIPTPRVERYLAALTRQIEAVRGELGPIRPVQLAIGGGTPTLLGPGPLEALFERIASRLDADPRHLPAGIETSPKTATPETIALLSAWGFDRISIGVQSFVEAETRAMGRPQDPATVTAALDTIRAHRFGRLNIDLIYGAENQTPQSWRHSLRRALDWAPEEMFLYPLYVRPRTGLDRRGHVEDEHRRALYRIGRDLLREAGYEQISMRAFRRPCPPDGSAGGDEFSCQEDGVLGLGTGARSYTARVHYATRYAVTRRGVLDILDDFAASDADAFRFAHHGIAVSRDDAMRRYVLKSILRRDGLDTARFAHLFGVAPTVALPALERIGEMGLIAADGAHLRPTQAGLEHSDAIPPLFYSERVRALMRSAGVA